MWLSSLVTGENVGEMDFNYHNPGSASCLSKAVRTGRLSLVKKLISRGKNPDIPDNRGWTSLHEASTDEDKEPILNFLLESGAYIEHKTVDGETPLFLASARGNHVGVASLLRHGADLNSRTNEGLTPLHAACLATSNLSTIKLLLGAGASPTAKDTELLEPIFVAIREKNLEAVELFLKLTPINFSVRDGQNILLYSIAKGNSDIFKAVVNKSKDGAEMARDFATVEGWTLLMEAAQARDPSSVELLLKLGADPGKVDNRGVTALHVAAHSLDNRSFPILLEATSSNILDSYCTFANRMSAPPSLPCLLMDSNNLSGLQVLLEAWKSGKVSFSVITCHVQLLSSCHAALAPAGFLLLRCSPLHYERKLEFLNLLVSYKVPLDVKIQSLYMTCIEALLTSHKCRQHHESLCKCDEMLKFLLMSDVILPSPSVIISLLLDSCFTSACHILLQFPEVITLNPNDLLVEFINRVTSSNYEFSEDGNEKQMLLLLVKTTNSFTPLQQLGEDSNPDRVNEEKLASLNCAFLELSKGHMVPELKQLARSTLRQCLLQCPRESRHSVFSKFLSSLPSSLVDYMQYKTL